MERKRYYAQDLVRIEGGERPKETMNKMLVDHGL